MHCFQIDAIHDPQSLPRIAGFFAQRAIVPSMMRMHSRGDHMRIEVTIAGLAPAQATIFAAKIGEIFAVCEVELHTDQPTEA